MVDNANEANYRIMLYTESNISAFSAVFIFSINRKTNDFLKIINFSLGLLLSEERSLNLFIFLSKKPRGRSWKRIFKKSIFLMIKLSVLNYINVKNRTRNKVVNIARPKSSSLMPFRAFSIIFSCIRKSNKVRWRGLLTYIQKIHFTELFILKVVAYYVKTNNELSQDATRRKVYL